MTLLLSLIFPAAAAPRCGPELSAASDLRQLLDALAAEVDDPGESAALSLRGGGDLKPGAEIANLMVELEGGVELRWAAEESGEVTLELSEGGEVGAGLDLGWSLGAGEAVSDRRGLSLRFESAEEARAFLIAASEGDPSALAALPSPSLTWERGEASAVELELGGAGWDVDELRAAAEQGTSRAHTLSADGLSITDQQQAAAELSAPFNGGEVAARYRYYRSAHAQTGEGICEERFALELPVADLRAVLEERGQEGLVEEVEAALPEGAGGEETAAALEGALADPGLSADASITLELRQSWQIDAEGNAIFSGRELAIETRRALSGEAELKAGEVSGSAEISRREVLSP